MHLAALVLPLAPLIVAAAAASGTRAQTRRVPGPCDPDACYEVIDASACWNAVVMGNEKDLQHIFTCTAGGKEEMCRCYGCDSLLDKLVVDNQLCAANSTGMS